MDGGGGATASGQPAAALYVDAAKLTPDARAQLDAAGVAVRPYDAALPDWTARAAAGERLWVDKARAPYALALDRAMVETTPSPAAHEAEKEAATTTRVAVPDAAPGVVVTKPSPVTLARARKNDAELDGMRACHVRDGAAKVGRVGTREK